MSTKHAATDAFVRQLLADGFTRDEVDHIAAVLKRADAARLAEAREVTALCRLAGKRHRAAALVAARATLKQAQAALREEQASAMDRVSAAFWAKWKGAAGART